MFSKPTAICIYLAPITVESLESDVVEVEHKLRKARSYYADKVAEYRREAPSCTDDEVRIMEQEGIFPRGGMECLRGSYARVITLEKHLANVKQVAFLLRPTSAKLRVVVVEAGGIAGELRSRGYRFERDGYGFGDRSRSAWCKRVFLDDLSLGLLAVELASLGIEIQMDGCLGDAVANVRYKMRQAAETGL